ncbi:hypothetical protein HNR60_000653 [Rhodopseudomonas rhenobacensis]|uniref:YARHG domain-containing protein n=1 Tax=Rhodopseudomonas rhenobacensis TaxID=87461 RepID=A0A7W8DXI3_9BRAD|nr:hypothetical protein [Rhodopseudomonas rhenobacensis]MBB5045918.1 hypothetical protein [Rhodopseudomonas rhenobacensis]
MLRQACVMLLVLAGAAALPLEAASAGGAPRKGVPRDGFYGVYGPYYAGAFRYNTGPDFSAGDCYPLRQRIMTRAGWQIRRIQICG